MTVGQGINKITVFKAQTGLGVPASGSGGQILRRRTSVLDRKRATFVNDEIVQHQQSTGVNLATATTDWAYDGLLSPGTFARLMEALLRKTYTAGVATSGLSVTIAGSAPIFTLTRSAGSYLTDGYKIGDVVRITAGTYTNGANRDNNLLVTGLTATVLTCIVVNATALIPEGPISGSTISVIGKKSMPPLTGHTDTLFTIEDWYADLSRSELFPDMRIAQADVGLPASGNATVKLGGMGLGVRTLSGTQVLTSPIAATVAPVLTAVRGAVLVNGSQVVTITGASFTVKANMTAEGPIMGSNYAPDMSRGRIEVSGQITGLFDAATLVTLYDAETVTSMVALLTADNTNAADFVSFNISAMKLTGSTPDDGEKAIVRTYPFTAQLNAAGGAALANDQTIISVQDSLA